MASTPVALPSSTLTIAGGANALTNVVVTGSAASVQLNGVTQLNTVSFRGVPVIANAPTYVLGYLQNNNTITLNAPLFASGVTTLTGSGDLLLHTEILADARPGAPAHSTLVNLNNTIHGIGTLNPNGDLAIINRSLIQAGTGEYLTIYGGTSASLINSGTIRAVNSGQITLYSGTLNNAGGLVQSSGSDSSIGILGMDISGGRFTADNGAFLGIGYSNLNNATLSASRSTLFLGYNALVQNTPLLLDRSIAELDANLTLRNLAISSTGSSVIEIGNSGFTRFENVRILNNTPVTTVGSGNQIQVSGGLVNTGTMTLGSASNTAHAIISGTVRLSGTGTVVLGGTGVTVSGSGGTLVNVDNTIRGTGIIGGGIAFINDGTVLAAPGDAITLESGTGASLSKVRNDNVFSLQNTATQTASIGVNGDFLQTGTATLSFHLGGILTSGSQWQLNFSPMTISGNASLAGAFHLTLDTGVVVNAGTVLTILTYGTETGSFTSFAGLDLPNGVTLVPSYTAHAFVLTAEAPIVFPSSPAPAGQSAPVEPSPSGPAPVPEPSSGALVLLAGRLLARCRRRASV